MSSPLNARSKLSGGISLEAAKQGPRVRPATCGGALELSVALLTGGHDASYAHGLTKALVERAITVDFIGSDALDAPFLHESSRINFLNLRGDQSEAAPFLKKTGRLSTYYWRLVRYAVRANPPIFHILWNNRVELIDRTALMILYRLCGRRILLTAHNVNAAARDGVDTWLNRATLRFQYGLTDHVFVHTQKMKMQLVEEFGVREQNVTVVPFGLNAEVPNTELTRAAARERLGLATEDRVGLVFGQIAPYKGVEYLIDAMPAIMEAMPQFRLVIAGRVKKGHEDYWNSLKPRVESYRENGLVVSRINHVPDQEVEVFFKAADVVILPYVEIFQSGVPFLAYYFGVPVISTDAGSLADDIVDGVTGYICQKQNPSALVAAVERFFDGTLYASMPEAAEAIRQRAASRYSWKTVAEMTETVYRKSRSG